MECDTDSIRETFAQTSQQCATTCEVYTIANNVSIQLRIILIVFSFYEDFQIYIQLSYYQIYKSTIAYYAGNHIFCILHQR